MPFNSSLTRTLAIRGCLLLAATTALAMYAPTASSQPANLGGPQRDCECSETIATYPYDEDFEEGEGSWQNYGDDDFDWDRWQGSTPTDGTGPDNDHTTGSGEGYYMYMESSGDNYPDKTAIFVGPCFDLSPLTQPEFAFWYNMAGDSIGSLAFEVSTDGCITWDIVDEIVGHQGYDWFLKLVDLSDYAGQTIAVRFRGVTGYAYTSDIAIDDIHLGEPVDYPGGCCDLDTGDCVGYMTESECEVAGRTVWHRMQDCTEENFCPQPPPANDDCINATVVDSLPFEDFEVEYKWAFPDIEVSCDNDECDESYYGVWYQYTPEDTCGAFIRLETTYGGSNTFISAFSGPDCDNLTEVFCSAEQTSSTWQEARFDVDGGVTYWILIGSYWCTGQPEPNLNITIDCMVGACCFGETCSLETMLGCEAAGGNYIGDGSVCEAETCLYGACCTSNGCESLTQAECAAAGGDFLGNGVPCYLDTCPPPNETCETAIVVTDGYPAAEGDTTLASFEDDEEASCHDSSDKDLWYVYTATRTGTLTINTENSYIWDTVLSVWDECDGEELECATDGPSGSQAQLEFDVIEGDVFYIRFAANLGISGMFQLNIECNEAPTGACCFGDDCTEEFEIICEAMGGTYAGDDTTCPGDDCNDNGVEDICDVVFGNSEDCNENMNPDECDIASGDSLDRDANGVPDECDPDCNDNGIIDGCDVSCDGGCAEIEGCGQSSDCQGDGIPDECQLADEGCDGLRYDTGEANFVDGVRPNWGWQHYGIADDFTLDQDEEGSCFRFDLFSGSDGDAFPVIHVRVYENYDGLMDLGDFWSATPVFDQMYYLDDGTLEIEDTGEDFYGLALLRMTATGTDWSLNEGDYAMHLTFPETTDAGFWATAGADDSDCSVYWGEWESSPRETCEEGVNLTNLSFALSGQADNDCNGNDIPDECDIADGTSMDFNGDGIPDECGYALGDFDLDGDVDLSDLAELLGVYGTCDEDLNFKPEIDLNGSRCIDLPDLAQLLANYTG